MKITPAKKLFFIFACHIFLGCLIQNVVAQKIEYSSENVFVNYPDNLQLVSNISGNHHLLTFIYNENPSIFIFDHDLGLQGKVSIPFKFPERSEIRILPFDKFYYLLIHPPLTVKYFFWRIDAKGNITDLSSSLQTLIRSQFYNARVNFQFIENKNELCMVFHTYLGEIEKNQTTILQLDSSLNVKFTNKVLYDLNRNEEQLQQEMLLPGKELVVLKTTGRGTTLELIKVNLSTGYTITNTFSSSGYVYSQCDFKYNTSDSSIIVYSILREPQSSSSLERSVFISKLDNSLVEQVPFTILKSQFPKNTAVNFLLVEGNESKWINFRRDQSYYVTYETVANYQPFSNTFQDFTNTDPRNTVSDPRSTNINDPRYLNNTLSAAVRGNQVKKYSEDGSQGIRFSLLDKKFKIANDSFVANNKNSYTLQADKFTGFTVKNKNYILLAQRFFKKSIGLLMVNSSNDNQLVFTDVRVNDRNDYLLSQSRTIPQMGIIIPYLHRREAGLVRISIE